MILVLGPKSLINIGERGEDLKQMYGNTDITVVFKKNIL